MNEHTKIQTPRSLPPKSKKRKRRKEKKQKRKEKPSTSVQLSIQRQMIVLDGKSRSRSGLFLFRINTFYRLTSNQQRLNHHSKSQESGSVALPLLLEFILLLL